jgi:mechanosensitive ion channel-like protein
MPVDTPVTAAIRHALLLVLIAAAAWLLVRLVYVVEDVAFQSLRIDVIDNRRARRVRTQIGVLRREGEWGRVEELTLTHVTLRLWDERRLMLPTSYFITTPFQNWTRNESRLLGAVDLHLDYRAPISKLRREARRVIERSPLWDRRDWVLEVVDSTPWSMVVRVLASAADAPSSWDLGCDVREQLITFLRDEHAGALPGPMATGPARWEPGRGDQ